MADGMANSRWWRRSSSARPRGRILATFGIVVTLAILAGVGIAPAPAGAQTPALQLSQTSGPAGAVVIATVSGFTPGDMIYLYEGATGYCVADTNGSCSMAFTVETLPSGTESLYAIDATTLAQASAPFTVTQALSLEPPSGLAGTSVTASATGFEADEVVTLTYGAQTPPLAEGTCTTNSGGNCTMTFDVPSGALGPVTTYATGATSGLVATTNFTEEPGPASLSLDPASGPAASQLLAQAGGFSESDTVAFSLDGMDIGTCVTGSTDGSCDARIVLPSLPAGSYEMTASDSDGVSAQATFTVTASVSLSPIAGLAGTNLTVTSFGFEPGESVSVTYDSTPVGSCVAGSNGSCSLALTVPSDPYGPYLVVATGASSGLVATATFAETGPLSLSLNPPSGPGGATFTATANGFEPGEVVAVNDALTNGFGAGQVYVTTCIADSTGACSVTLDIPDQAAGPLTVTATGSTTGLQTTATFEVTPYIDNMSGSDGPAGLSLNLALSSFAANEVVDVSLAGSTSSCTTDTYGACNTKIVVPSVAGGTYEISATDSSGNNATVGFQVVASLSLDPTTGSATTTVTAMPQGFQPGETVNVSYNASVVGSCIAGSNGACTDSFTPPHEHPGPYPVTATGVTSGSTASATFDQTPILTFSQTSVVGGTPVTATFEDYPADQLIQIALLPPMNGTMASCTTDASGDCSTTFDAPDLEAGVYIFTGNGGGYIASATLEYALAPGISFLSQSAGPLAGGYSVTLTGGDFVRPASVSFGANAATAVSVVNSGSITATVPAGTGTVNVTVTTPYGTSAPVAFTYLPVPTVTKITNDRGGIDGGTMVQITGTGFVSPADVTFGGPDYGTANVVVVDSTHITATSPANVAGKVDVQVRTLGGVSSTSKADRFNYIPAPTLTSVTPARGPAAGGTSISLVGTGFVRGTVVHFGDTRASNVVIVSTTKMTATTPPKGSGHRIWVSNPGGSSAPFVFTYIAS